MYRISKSYLDRVAKGETPTVYFVINTNKGNRIYSDKELAGCFEQFYFTAGGSFRADGLVTVGNGVSALDKANRIISKSGIVRSIQPRTRDVINSLTNKQQNSLDLTLDNSDFHFSRILPTEPFLTKPLWVYVGFESDNFANHLILFQGFISQIELSKDQMTLFAEEK